MPVDVIGIYTQTVGQLGQPWPLPFAIVTGNLAVVSHPKHCIEHRLVQVDGHVGFRCLGLNETKIEAAVVGDQEICAIDGLCEFLQGFSFVTGAKFCQAFLCKTVDLDGLFLNPALVFWPVEKPALLGHLLEVGVEYLPRK